MLTRLTLLYVGLALFGFGIGLLLLADLGVPPWDVFHTGLADLLGWSLGPTIVVTSFVVLLAWIPLRERPGLGTVSNAALVGTFIDLAGHVLPDTTPDSIIVRIALVVAGIVINGIATGMYIGAQFGPGPRDGLMTALAATDTPGGVPAAEGRPGPGGRTRPARPRGIPRRRWSVRTVRTAIEVAVLAAGIALGGEIGVATVVFAVAIGPIAHRTIPFFTRLASAKPVPAATWVPAVGE